MNKDVRISIIVRNQQGFGERKLSGKNPLEGPGFCNKSFRPELYNLELNDMRTLLVKISTAKLEKRKLFQCSIRDKKLVQGFFFEAVLFHKDPKSPSVETVTGYKPFGFVPSSFIKVKRNAFAN